VRWTLAAAVAGGVVTASTAAVVEGTAKTLAYPERVWRRILSRAAEAGARRVELEALRRWLPGGRLDRKREDALQMLRAIDDALARGPVPRRPRFTVARSRYWARAQQAIESESSIDRTGAPW
jgi:hypothetical protein